MRIRINNAQRVNHLSELLKGIVGRDKNTRLRQFAVPDTFGAGEQNTVFPS
jgi:hypothetical protein